MTPHPLAVAAFYRFVPLPDCAVLQPELARFCADLGVKGTILLAAEGINGTVAGTPAAIATLIAALRGGPLFGDRLAALEVKHSTAARPPFGRLKVRVKREIVRFDEGVTDPARGIGQSVTPRDWNELLDQPGIVPIDTRNGFEVALGSFEGAVDPGIGRFADFIAYAEDRLLPSRPPAVALFCTGGIRCEKAAAYLVDRGYDRVYTLKGGILTYLETISEGDSRWTGSCFVFDERGALGHGLV